MQQMGRAMVLAQFRSPGGAGAVFAPSVHLRRGLFEHRAIARPLR